MSQFPSDAVAVAALLLKIATKSEKNKNNTQAYNFNVICWSFCRVYRFEFLD